MTDTRDKLNEAKYFFQRINDTTNDQDQFRYNLCAFISACRNVTWVMKKEFSDYPDFLILYEKKKSELNIGLMNYFVKQRNITTKERGVKVTGTIQIFVHEGVCVNLTPIYVSGTSSGVSPIDRQANVPYPHGEWFFDDIPDRSVISLCQEYLNEIAKLVDWCESEKFEVLDDMKPQKEARENRRGL